MPIKWVSLLYRFVIDWNELIFTEYPDEVTEEEVGADHSAFPKIVAALGVEAVVVVPDHACGGVTGVRGVPFGTGMSSGRGVSLNIPEKVLEQRVDRKKLLQRLAPTDIHPKIRFL